MIETTGNVGIPTISPNVKLQVVGDLKVPETVEETIEREKDYPKPKYKIGDEVFYLGAKGIVLVKIEDLDFECNMRNGKFSHWAYPTDYEETVYMGGVFAPMTFILDEDKLFSTKQELIDGL